MTATGGDSNLLRRAGYLVSSMLAMIFGAAAQTPILNTIRNALKGVPGGDILASGVIGFIDFIASATRWNEFSSTLEGVAWAPVFLAFVSSLFVGLYFFMRLTGWLNKKLAKGGSATSSPTKPIPSKWGERGVALSLWSLFLAFSGYPVWFAVLGVWTTILLGFVTLAAYFYISVVLGGKGTKLLASGWSGLKSGRTRSLLGSLGSKVPGGVFSISELNKAWKFYNNNPKCNGSPSHPNPQYRNAPSGTYNCAVCSSKVNVS